MKSKFSLLLFAFIFCAFSSCLKKGEDDPLISLRTRKARVVGKWKIQSGTYYQKTISGFYVSEENHLYTNDSYEQVMTVTAGGSPLGSPEIKKGSFEYSMEFKKDGKFISTKVQNGVTTESIGTWNFTIGIGKNKNKEQIVIDLASETYEPGLISFNYPATNTDLTYSIKELRNKKIVLTFEKSEVKSVSYELNTNAEYTFEQ